MFNKSKEVEVVPRSWVVQDDGKWFCYWPTWNNLDKIYKAAKDQQIPNKKLWKRLAIRIFHDFDNYDAAVSEIEQFLNYLDYETTGSVQQNPPTISIHNSSDSDNDTSPSSIGRNYTLGPVELPPPPTPAIPTASTSKRRPSIRPKLLTSNDEGSPVDTEVHGTNLASDKVSASGIEDITPIKTYSTVPVLLPAGNNFQQTIGSDFQTMLLQEIRGLQNVCIRNFASVKLQQANLVLAVENLRLKFISEVPQKELAQTVKFPFPFKGLPEFLDFEAKLKDDNIYRSNAVKF
ncbi:unnamed protein product [Allacma fusca]|uniref:Uncharacterized protein n=1 Tax=Allacma fusca TaxID=39272 RepID=A0A8J2K384_9HEXA|nr:unnamed protein product [Allacma fusca]